ncbi:unnamed protein product [Ectocarpus sp. 6 AP-2014]
MSEMAMAKAAPEKEVDTALLVTRKNPRGIPEVVFIDDVVQFLARLGVEEVETPIGAFNELYSKYKLMESNMDKAKQSMKDKVPEIERSLELVRHLQERQDKEETVKTNYSLADTVFAKAELKCDGRVCIWLGASVMVEYTYKEALELLERNLATALEKKKTTQEDLEFLRNQSITVEVNMARLYNYDVLRRRKAEEAKKRKEETKSAA